VTSGGGEEAFADNVAEYMLDTDDVALVKTIDALIREYNKSRIPKGGDSYIYKRNMTGFLKYVGIKKKRFNWHIVENYWYNQDESRLKLRGKVPKKVIKRLKTQVSN
jgi:hypothetical protein